MKRGCRATGAGQGESAGESSANTGAIYYSFLCMISCLLNISRNLLGIQAAVREGTSRVSWDVAISPRNKNSNEVERTSSHCNQPCICSSALVILMKRHHLVMK